MRDEQTTRWLIGAGLLTTMLAGAVIALRWRRRLGDGSVYPPQRRYPLAPWSGAELALALILYLAIPQFVTIAIHLAGLLPEFDPTKEPGIELQSRLLLVRGIAAPLLLIAVLAMLWQMSRTRPKTLGLRRWRWKSSLYIAYATYFLTTPLVIGLNFLATWLNRTINVDMQSHTFQRLVEQDPRPSVLVLVTMHAVVFAPVLEELLFRGIMLPWLGRRWWGGWAAMAAAIAMGLAMVGQQRAPLAFALIVSVIGMIMTLPHAGEQWARRSIIGTALLFAMFHVSVWPTPIPLLVLGLALGWAAHRTRGLIAPIVIHSLFNATSTLMMLAGIGSDPPPPKPETPVVMRTGELSLRP